MQLFKRMMLSLFPDEMANNPVNPASMFVWFISAKQYFSVITRRIVENYKLNLFDISLDPFEVKIWFGENPTIKVKDVDFYYGYAAAANLQWYKNYAPWQLAHTIALLSSIYCQEISEEYEEHYTLNFVYAVYLLTFIFQWKVKQFPHIHPRTTKEKESNFSRFIQLFFSFYQFLLEQSGKVFDRTTITQIKKQLLKDHMELFFMLQYFYQYAAKTLDLPWVTIQQFFWWLFYDELQGWELQRLAQDFVAQSETNIHTTIFTTTERNLIPLLFPADILVKYILDAPDIHSTIRHMIAHFFPMDKIEPYMRWFLTSDKDFSMFLQEIADYTYFKNTYFDALKKYITYTFQRQDAFDVQQSKEVDERMSTIGDMWSIDMSQLPERLKKESETMERLMNFYVTYVWWSWIARWDSRYIRWFYPDILKKLHTQLQQKSRSDGSYYYTWLLKNYGKNNFYYKYAFENIRAGKERFQLPFRASFRETYSNMCIVRLFESSFLAILMQDLLPKDVKMYTKAPKIVGEFWRLFQKKISQLTKKSHKDLITTLYSPYNDFFTQVRYDEILVTPSLKSLDQHIKENMYTLDFWLHQNILERLKPYATKLQEVYSDASIAGVMALLRETLLWFLMYCVYLQYTESDQEKIHINMLMNFYIVDVLVLSEEFVPMFSNILSGMMIAYVDILKMLYEIDDNKAYFKIAKDNWLTYCAKKTPEEILSGFLGEDVIWYRWFLKTISYYSKRYILP